ncbi:hypothetical protein RhiLY_04288 [Ceratobasidium sp. AG-Ba]|nr:hypothetical protein RhiLY_04288 [Ceratobasidium sp. AG-Ba]
MGDTQRVEAFDVDGRAVLVALRQGGIEATDVGQALLEPADESRTALPNYKVAPGAISRRSPYVWRLGTAVTSAGDLFGSTNGKRRAGGTGASGKKRTASSKQNGSSHVAIHANDSGDESDIYIAPEEEVIFLAREQDNVYGEVRALLVTTVQDEPDCRYRRRLIFLYRTLSSSRFLFLLLNPHTPLFPIYTITLPPPLILLVRFDRLTSVTSSVVHSQLCPSTIPVQGVMPMATFSL